MPDKEVVTVEHLQQWLREKIAEEIGLQPGEVSMDAPFSSHHLDSLSLVSLSYDLEVYTGLVIDPTVFLEFDTPNRVAQWVQSQMK